MQQFGFLDMLFYFLMSYTIIAASVLSMERSALSHLPLGNRLISSKYLELAPTMQPYIRTFQTPPSEETELRNLQVSQTSNPGQNPRSQSFARKRKGA